MALLQKEGHVQALWPSNVRILSLVVQTTLSAAMNSLDVLPFSLVTAHMSILSDWEGRRPF